MSAVTLSKVSKEWGESLAVDAVSWTAAEGSLLVLVGPSGCGKSTTLRLVAGLEEVSSGTVEIGGVDVTRLSPSKRRISMVFQSYALFPHLSVAENIVFGLRVRGVAAAQRRQRLARVAELVGLGGLLDRRPSQLSGGQRQRVALGRAVIAEAPVCLMDEPLSNLDAKLRQEMRAEIRSLQRRLGITMIYVTHDQTEAMSMADHIVLMHEGRVVQTGAPDTLYERPGTEFAARFIGTPPMNLLRLADGGRGAVIAGTRGPAVLEDGGAGLLLGIRPEHLVPAERGGIKAEVQAVEYFGADSVVSCTFGGQPLAVRVPGRAGLEPGSPLRVAWRSEHLHLFDAASGRRVDSEVSAARFSSVLSSS